MSDHFDRILSGVPVNAQTAKTMAHGEPYEPALNYRGVWSETPLPTRRVETGVDLTGLRCGDLTVKGLHAEQRKGNGKRQAWVVRCVCGLYETRTARALRNPGNVGDRCHRCRHLEALRHRDRQRQLGGRRADERSDRERRALRHVAFAAAEKKGGRHVDP